MTQQFSLTPVISVTRPEDEIMANRGKGKSREGLHSEVILDNFSTLSEVSEAIRQAGLESSNLIFGKSP